MEPKTIIALIAVGLTLFGYSFYFRDIFAGRTKPHAFSWLVWALLTTIAFFGQISDGGGAGAWVIATTALISFVIFGLALSRGEKEITKTDKIYLVAPLLAIVPWLLTKDPVISIVLITGIDFLGFLPTIRKSIHKPYEETLIHYAFAGLKFLLSVVALGNYSIVTVLYPASLVVTNWAFIVLLVVQRKKMKQHRPSIR